MIISIVTIFVFLLVSLSEASNSKKFPAITLSSKLSKNAFPNYTPEILRHPSNGFSIIFRGICYYNILKNGHFPDSPILVSAQDLLDLEDICRKAALDGRTLVLFIENESDILDIQGNIIFDSLIEMLKIKYIAFADKSAINYNFLSIFTKLNVIIINQFEYGRSLKGNLVFNLECDEPSKALRNLDKYLVSREAEPSSFSISMDPKAQNLHSLSESEKIVRFNQESTTTANPSIPTLHLNISNLIYSNNLMESLTRLADQKYVPFPLKFDFIKENRTESYALLTSKIFDPRIGIFKSTVANPNVFLPSSKSSHIFNVIGKIIGIGLMEKLPLNFRFSKSFYKLILGRTPNLNDLEEVDPVLYQNLCQIADFPLTISKKNPITFIFRHKFGNENYDISLKPEGWNIKLSEGNKFEYIRLVVEFILEKIFQRNVEAFLQGFWLVVPKGMLMHFTVPQLEKLFAGVSWGSLISDSSEINISNLKRSLSGLNSALNPLRILIGKN